METRSGDELKGDVADDDDVEEWLDEKLSDFDISKLEPCWQLNTSKLSTSKDAVFGGEGISIFCWEKVVPATP